MGYGEIWCIEHIRIHLHLAQPHCRTNDGLAPPRVQPNFQTASHNPSFFFPPFSAARAATPAAATEDDTSEGSFHEISTAWG